MNEDFLEKVIAYAENHGASYADTRYQEYYYSTITCENGKLKSFESGNIEGIGIRIIIDGVLGFASSNLLEMDKIIEKINQAMKFIRISKNSEIISLSETNSIKNSLSLSIEVDPEDFSDREKVEIVLNANKCSMIEGVKNSITRLGWMKDRRLFLSSERSIIEVCNIMSGYAQFSAATFNNKIEYVSDSKSRCSGFEFIKRADISDFAKNISEKALKAVKAETPRSGLYDVVVDPELIGLILHEAFGHASEADLITNNESVLKDFLGKEVANQLVTIIDDGLIQDGYYIPYDDEGVKKERKKIIQDGVLIGFINSRETAKKLSNELTGNGRAQSYNNKPIVRQTNLFMEPKDQNLTELLEDVKDGFYICGSGATGGEVDVGNGNFTFRAGPSYTIKNGEIGDLVRGISISGTILETLKKVDGVGKDFKIRTSLFGGCGKDGQRVIVGHGGPSIRIRGMAIGGS